MAHRKRSSPPPGRRVWDRVVDNPVSVVALLAAARAVWDVARVRPLGAYPVDDAGFMASALAVHREATVDGVVAGLLRALDLPGGPLMPLVELPPLALFGRDVAALAVAPAVCMAVAAILVAAITARIATGGAALVAGVVAIGLPSALLAARSHQVVVLAAPMLLLAVWALLASDRGRRRWLMVLCGAAVAATVLARPMTVAYVPGIGVAAALLIGRDRRALQGVGIAVATAAALLAPWLVRAGDQVVDYLFGHGYGAEAAEYGPVTPPVRVAVRVLLLGVDVRVGLLLVGALTLVVATREAARRGLIRPRLPPPGPGRDVLALAAIVAFGYVALMTTSNTGVWFELPLELVMVCVGAGLAPLLGRWRRPLGIAAVAASVIAVAGIGQARLPSIVMIDNDGDPVRLDAFAFADMWETGLVEVDPSWRCPRADVEGGAAEWWAAHQEVLVAVRASPAPVGVVGSAAPMNLSTLELADELGASTVPPLVAVDDQQDLASGAVATVVLVEARSDVLPGAAESGALAEALEDAGWASVSEVPLPDGGRATVMTATDR